VGVEGFSEGFFLGGPVLLFEEVVADPEEKDIDDNGDDDQDDEEPEVGGKAKEAEGPVGEGAERGDEGDVEEDEEDLGNQENERPNEDLFEVVTLSDENLFVFFVDVVPGNQRVEVEADEETLGDGRENPDQKEARAEVDDESGEVPGALVGVRGAAADVGGDPNGQVHVYPVNNELPEKLFEHVKEEDLPDALGSLGDFLDWLGNRPRIGCKGRQEAVARRFLCGKRDHSAQGFQVAL
jgi:hypothetical protein